MRNLSVLLLLLVTLSPAAVADGVGTAKPHT
jgi:hypothetical protein